jgi:hypothetical protein
MTADAHRPVRYLSRAEVAERIGVKPDTLGRYRLPEPDAVIGQTRGWLLATVDAWNAARPSKMDNAQAQRLRRKRR